jgi:hypothetical protein
MLGRFLKENLFGKETPSVVGLGATGLVGAGLLVGFRGATTGLLVGFRGATTGLLVGFRGATTGLLVGIRGAIIGLLDGFRGATTGLLVGIRGAIIGLLDGFRGATTGFFVGFRFVGICAEAHANNVDEITRTTVIKKGSRFNRAFKLEIEYERVLSDCNCFAGTAVLGA